MEMLDEIRKEKKWVLMLSVMWHVSHVMWSTRKFICLNDNIDHSKDGAHLVGEATPTVMWLVMWSLLCRPSWFCWTSMSPCFHSHHRLSCLLSTGTGSCMSLNWMSGEEREKGEKGEGVMISISTGCSSEGVSSWLSTWHAVFSSHWLFSLSSMGRYVDTTRSWLHTFLTYLQPLASAHW